jgi:hypothetical protein
MKITIESTSKVVTVNELPVRIWEGETESGIPIHCYVTRVAVDEGLAPGAYKVFEAELAEQKKPSAKVEAIPLRMIL